MSDSRARSLPSIYWWFAPFTVLALLTAVGYMTDDLSGRGAAVMVTVVAVTAAGLFHRLGALRQELGVATHQAAAAIQHTQELQRREILLGSVLESTPAAMILCDDSGIISYANRGARELLFSGKRYEGESLSSVLADRAPKLQEAIELAGDAMIALDLDGDRETFLVSSRPISITGERRKLHMIRRMTGEVNRTEVESWKKLIRVLNHELNNSLAPISSLVHSAKLIATRPDKADKLAQIFDTISERAEHLHTFLESYADFARLPQPNKAALCWAEFLERLGHLAEFRLVGVPPEEPGCVDPAQLQQVMINLLKNSHEVGSVPEVEVSRHRGGARVTVRDQGPGMSPEILEKALLPFFSTKGSGTGLGLALCRDIVEAHGGELRLQNREAGGLEVHCWLPDGPPAHGAGTDMESEATEGLR